MEKAPQTVASLAAQRMKSQTMLNSRELPGISTCEKGPLFHIKYPMEKATPGMQAQCPSCGAMLTVRPTGAVHERVQCPKCLNIIDLTQLESGRTPGLLESDQVVDRSQAAEGDGSTATRDSDVHALIVETEVLAARNTALNSKLEGLQAEREVILGQHAEFADAIRDLKHRLAKSKGRTPSPQKRAVSAPRPQKKDLRIAELESELGNMRQRLSAAEAALRDAAKLLSRLAELEAQLLGLGRTYLGVAPGTAGVENAGAGGEPVEEAMLTCRT